MNKFGFPKGKPKQAKVVKGFQTGDIVKAIVPEQLKTAGVHIGRVAVRATGSFDITDQSGKTTQGVNHCYCAALHRCDGYSYGQGTHIPKKGALVSSLPL